MKILFLISGSRVPSSRFRVLPYISHLRSAGHTCTVLSSFPQKYDYFRVIGFRASQLLKRFVRFLHLLQARLVKYDVVVLERELFDAPTWEFERSFRRLIPVMILDIDDAIFLRYPEKFREITSMCDHVLAGNRLLAEEAQRYCSEVTVVPTAVEPSEYLPRQSETDSNTPPVIGWIGTSSNVEYLKRVVPVLKHLKQECNFVFRIVTGQKSDLHSIDFGAVDVQFREWRPKTAAQEVCRFDIGIMPLPDTEWTRYKCGFKLLQYMAAGIPAVGSPVGVNCEMIQSGRSGFLPRSDEEWLNALCRLLEDEELRRSLGARGREILKDRYTVESNVPRIMAAIEKSRSRDRSPSPSSKESS